MKGRDWTQTVFTDLSEKFLRPAFPRRGQLAQVRLRLAEYSPVSTILLRLVSGPQKKHLVMRRQGVERGLAYYVAELPIQEEQTRFFFVLLQRQEQVWFYTRRGLQRHPPSNEQAFLLRADHALPAWVRDRVFYQIFVDRFYDGDPGNNVRTGEYRFWGKSAVARRWGDAPYSFRRSLGLDFFGGDLAGIQRQLPYLQELGVNALYLTPIFTSPSNHKYDTEDFRRVDPHFGTNRQLAGLSSQMHRAGMRLLLDAVLNHVGSSHPWFDRGGSPGRIGAYHHPGSRYRDYFLFRGRSPKYLCWYGAKNLPQLNYFSPRLRREIYGNSSSLVRRWLRPPYNIDGWRFDAIDVVGNYPHGSCHRQVLAEVRQAALQANPQAFLLGEHLCDYTYLVNDGYLHSGINFMGFYLPVRNILAPDLYYLIEGRRLELAGHGYSFDTFVEELAEMRQALGGQYLPYTFNFLSNHDLPRFLHVTKDRAKLPAALAMLFGYPGLPCIYYGDEIGLCGGEDPDNRRCMVWDRKQWDQKIRQDYLHWIARRRSTPALQTGSFQQLLAADGILAFAREAEKGLALVAINFSGRSRRVTLPLWKIGLHGEWLQPADGRGPSRVQNGFLPLALGPYSAALFTL